MKREYLCVLILLALTAGCGSDVDNSQADNESTEQTDGQTDSDTGNTDGDTDSDTGGQAGDSGDNDGSSDTDNNTIEPPDFPPFDGTIFIDPDIVNADDPGAFQSISSAGTAQRQMYDRRVGWITISPYLFQANYDDGLSIEVQVNPEFSETEAAAEAERYAALFGQLPTLLRRDVETSWIHKGVHPWGGGNRNLLIHTGQGQLYINDGIAEETLIHEASHTSLDEYHSASPAWLQAQADDPTFISTYARDNPDREDIAESFLPYVALRYRRDRISDELAATIEATIPNRIQYFDSIVQDMYPLE